MTLRTAVIGGGTVSGVHLDGLDRNPRTDLVAICDLDEDIARDIATEYGIRAFFDVEEMLAELDLDWVHVCTPVQTHLAIAKTVIEAGIPVQIEKPITETYEEFEELAAFAERHDVVVSEKHNHAFDPVVRRAMQAKRNGELGEVRGVDVIYTGSSRPDDPNRGPWNFDLAGGEFEEGIPHPIYLTLRAGGYPRSESSLATTTALFGDYERSFDYDGAQIQYVTDDEVLCTTKMLGGTRPVRELILHGSKKSLTADLLSQTLIEHDRDYKRSAATRALNNVDQAVDRFTGTIANARAVLNRSRNDDWDTLRLLNAHYYQNDAESRALEAGDPSRMPVPLSESRWMILLMEEIRDTARRGDPEEFGTVEASVGGDE
ncbi:oxidoreductase domain-containing protein [Halorubrum aidingense JCM 13560]|uniref:Oxidoreductase domain-containing protein n=1 Tax=Halorubrum aidingense JCM 13560 TaxID=1230454 RepID=M0PLW6_9EURY|nr:Gfo/Idh/MocA family oxidoreductase [Halorubrum aidingense]EMA70639.1 oxidoreductase domain-containing protein [Halorubrum aidingense JCM 13560]